MLPEIARCNLLSCESSEGTCSYIWKSNTCHHTCIGWAQCEHCMVTIKGGGGGVQFDLRPLLSIIIGGQHTQCFVVITTQSVMVHTCVVSINTYNLLTGDTIHCNYVDDLLL